MCLNEFGRVEDRLSVISRPKIGSPLQDLNVLFITFLENVNFLFLRTDHVSDRVEVSQATGDVLLKL